MSLPLPVLVDPCSAVQQAVYLQLDPTYDHLCLTDWQDVVFRDAALWLSYCPPKAPVDSVLETLIYHFRPSLIVSKKSTKRV